MDGGCAFLLPGEGEQPVISNLPRKRFSLEAIEPRVLLSTIYVDAAATGIAPDGTSWASAFVDLQDALAAAATNDQIRAADGTYKPTPTADRTISFQLKNDVSILGGYAGYGAANPDARDVAAYPTVLSGDIGTAGTSTDNSYHVIVAGGTSATAVLDGVTVTCGYGNGFPGSTGQGGGIYNIAGSPTINNCAFISNSAYNGGAIYNYAASPSITNCTFTANTAISSQIGGAIDNVSSGSPVITNCTFTSNSAYWGGAIYGRDAVSLTLSNCTFIGNTAQYGAAVGSEYGGSLSAVNCTFLRNTSTYLGGAIYHQSSAGATITACGFLGNTASSDGGGVYIFQSYASSSITNCAFVGNKATYGSGGGVSIIGPTSVTNCTFTANSAGYTGGGLYLPTAVTVTNCIVWDNSPNGIYSGSGATVSYSDVQGGYTGTNNMNIDPRFVRNPSPGGDLTWGTGDDDYGDLQLQPGSEPPLRCIDRGNSAAVPAGITTDLAGNPRFIDYPPINANTVDMGAYERQPTIAVQSGVFEFEFGQTVRIQFNEAVLGAQTPDLLLHNLTNGLDYTATAAQPIAPPPVTSVRWWFSGLPDGNYRATLPAGSVTDAARNPIATPFSFDFFILAGDANGDRKVDVRDLMVLTTNWGGSGKVFSRGDFNYDSIVNADDLGILASRWQMALSPPVSLVPAVVRTPRRAPVRVASLVL
jgi:predicted outer membrane repeat protein